MSQDLTRRSILALSAAVAGHALLSSNRAFAADRKRRVVVWSEGTAPKNVYPNDINGAVAEGLKKALPDWEVVTASLDDPEQGITDDLLKGTDVLIWWGHRKHGQVRDSLVAQIDKRVKEDGMGFIALHSSHFSKALKKLLGTACSFKAYVVDNPPADVKVIVKDKSHPIAKGISDFTLPQTERYSEPFAIPEPETVVFDGVYGRPGGVKEESRQGLVFKVGKGKVFYFQPGHETYPHFFDENVRKILANAVEFVAPK